MTRQSVIKKGEGWQTHRRLAVKFYLYFCVSLDILTAADRDF